MSKRASKLPTSFVPVRGDQHQGLLFADARTTQQNEIIKAADGSRTVAAIAHECGIRRDECEKIIAALIVDGELKEAPVSVVLKAADRLQKQTKLEEAIQLYQSILTHDPEEESALEQLAQLLSTTAHTKDAAATYSHLHEIFVRQGRLGEALNAARRAAGLQPGNWTHQNALAELCIMTGRPDEAARTWRAYAKRLSAIDKFDQALMIIDDAERKLPGNDILLYAEAEILSANERGNNPPPNRNPRVKLEPPKSEFTIREPFFDLHAQAQKVIKKNRLGIAAYLIATAVLLIICISAYVFQIHEGMRRAIGDSAGILSASASDPLHKKLEAAELALKKITEAEPFTDIFQSTEFIQQKMRVNEFLKKATKELDLHRQQQAIIIEDWQKQPGEKNLAPLRALSQNPDSNSPHVKRAIELYKKWLKESALRSEEQKDLINQLNDQNQTPQNKYEAYTRLFVNYPDSFNYNFPQGAKNLTIPSQIQLFCGSYQMPLKFSLTINGNKVAPPYRLPLDPQSKIILQHPGFKIIGDKKNTANHTALPRPFTHNQIFIMRKTPRWKITLEGSVTDIRTMISDNNKYFIYADNNITGMIDIASAKQKMFAANINPDTANPQPNDTNLITSLNDLTFVASGYTAKKIAPFNLQNITPEAITLKHDTTITAAQLAQFSAPALLTLSWPTNDKRVINAYDVKTLTPLWANPTTSTQPSRPTGNIFVTGWDIFYTDANAYLHYILENGEEQNVWQLDGLEYLQEPPLYYSSKTFGNLLIAQGKDKLACYKIQPGQNPAVVRLWESNTSSPFTWLTISQNILIAGHPADKELTVINLTNGHITQKYQPPVSLTTQPLATSDRLYLPTTANNKTKLYAVQIENNHIGNIIWDMPLPGPILGLSVKELNQTHNLVGFYSSGELYLLDD